MKKHDLYTTYYSILGFFGLIISGLIAIGYIIYYPIWTIIDFLKK